MPQELLELEININKETESMKFKTLADYQKEAHKTCMDNCWNEEYLTMGLISEIGEIADKVKKNIRDNGGEITEKFKADILMECGDVCWYIAEFAKFLNIDISVFETETEYISMGNRVTWLNYHASSFITDQDPNDVRIMFYEIHSLAKDFGSSLHEVMVNNIKKLSSRKDRGALHGSGDNR